MKKLSLLSLGLMLVAGLVTGCGKSSPSQPSSQSATPTPQDIAQVNRVIATSPGFVNEDVYEGTQASQLDPANGALAAIRPIFWWRKIDSATRTFETEYTDPDSTGRPTMATVTVHRLLTGSFNIVAGNDTTSHPDSIVHKPLEDSWVRKLLLKRGRDITVGDTVITRWRLVGTSGVEVTSKDAVTDIQSVRIQAGTLAGSVLDTTITDPLQLHRLRRVLHLPTGSQVIVTVTTGATDDVVLLYRWLRRVRFINNGDGTYTAGWISGDQCDQDRDLVFAASHDGDGSWVRNFGVNALSHGTLYDSASPYDSNAWVFAFGFQRDQCDLDHDDDHDGDHDDLTAGALIRR
jgi:hypothetical protein